MEKRRQFNLTIVIRKNGQRFFYPLLEQGVYIESVTGCTLRAFLKDKLAVDDTYLDKRVQTLFLNGRPVDDMDELHIGDGDRLALSAAMPGLVGATMRRGGHLAGMRKSISECRNDECRGEGRGTIELRIYNLLLNELGLHLLSCGVGVKGERFADLLVLQKGNMEAEVTEAVVGGKSIGFDGLMGLPLRGAEVYFRCAVEVGE